MIKDEKQTVTIIAKDAYGNCTMKDTTLTLKKDNSIQIVNSPFLVKIKRSKLVIFKLPLSTNSMSLS